jgi:hypothetical protein
MRLIGVEWVSLSLFWIGILRLRFRRRRRLLKEPSKTIKPSFFNPGAMEKRARAEQLDHLNVVTS